MESYYLHSLNEKVVILYLSELKDLLKEQISVFNQVTESVFLKGTNKVNIDGKAGLGKWIGSVKEKELLNNNNFLALKHTNVVYGNTLRNIINKIESNKRVDRNEYKVLMTAHELMIKDLLSMISSLTETKFQTDPLTGAINRAAFENILKDETIKLKRSGGKSFLAFADIDFFKKINDSYGHAEGDAILKKVVSVFKKAVRSSDTVARWGGEEFLILLTDTSLSNAKKVLERIRMSIKDDLTSIRNGEEHIITCSFGFSELLSDYEKSIIISDDALYEAKNSGRDVVVYKGIQK